MEKGIQVFTNQTANGQTTDKVVGNGRRMLVAAQGTWDTATLKAQLSPDEGTTWFDTEASTALTADGSKVFFVPDGFHVRLDLSSVGGTTDINAWLGFLFV